MEEMDRQMEKKIKTKETVERTRLFDLCSDVV